MTIYQQIVAACWGVLLIVWFVLALALGQRTGHHSRRAWLLRLTSVAVLVIAAYLITRGRPPLVLVEPTRAIAITGVALCIAGLGFALWSRITMGRHWATPTAEREEIWAAAHYIDNMAALLRKPRPVGAEPLHTPSFPED